MEKLLLTITETAAATGMSRSRIFELLREGELEAKRAGRRTLVTADSLRRCVDRLPPARPFHRAA
jgi:excisionase family DNA binding protein